MTIEELAEKCNISAKHLIKKAKLIEIFPSGPKDTLPKDEMLVLARIAHMTPAKINGFSEGLKSISVAEKLSFLRGQTLNNSEFESLEKEIEDKPAFKKDVNKSEPIQDSSINKKLVRDLEKQIAANKRVLDMVNDLSNTNFDEINNIKEIVFRSEQTISQLEENILKSLILEEDLDQVKNNLSELNNVVQLLHDKHENNKYTTLSNRLKSTVKQSFNNSNQLPEFRSIEDIQQSFLERNLAYPKKLIQDIIIGLKKGNIFLLGPSGIGKTSLIKNLHLFFNEHQKELKLSYNTVVPEWESYDILGGKVLVDNKLAPHLGIFTKCVLKCIETNVNTFVIFDELNRGRVDDMFSGLMDWLSTDDGILKFSELDLIEEGMETIKVPSNLRVIGILNNFHPEFLHPLSNQLKRRFSLIYFEKPDLKLEMEIVYSIIESHKREIATAKSVNYENLKLYDEILEIISAFRQIEYDLDLNKTLFGTSYIVDVLTQIKIMVINGYETSVDKLIHDGLLASILNSPPNVKQIIIDKIMTPFKLNICLEKISRPNYL